MLSSLRTALAGLAGILVTAAVHADSSRTQATCEDKLCCHEWGVDVRDRGGKVWGLIVGDSPRAFDGRGNYTLGIRDQLIFPEINYAKVQKVKGMNICIVTSAKTDEEGRALLTALGMPFRK